MTESVFFSDEFFICDILKFLDGLIIGVGKKRNLFSRY